MNIEERIEMYLEERGYMSSFMNKLQIDELLPATSRSMFEGRERAIGVINKIFVIWSRYCNQYNESEEKRIELILDIWDTRLKEIKTICNVKTTDNLEYIREIGKFERFLSEWRV